MKDIELVYFLPNKYWELVIYKMRIKGQNKNKLLNVGTKNFCFDIIHKYDLQFLNLTKISEKVTAPNFDALQSVFKFNVQ